MKDEKQKSKRIVKYEYSQLWIGVVATILVFIVVYVLKIEHKHEPEKKPTEFLALLAFIMAYKLWRYKRHKKR